MIAYEPRTQDETSDFMNPFTKSNLTVAEDARQCTGTLQVRSKRKKITVQVAIDKSLPKLQEKSNMTTRKPKSNLTKAVTESL